MAVPFWALDEKWKEALQKEMENTWIMTDTTWLMEEVKEKVKEINFLKPITKENIEIGENVPKEVVEHILKYNFQIKNPKFIKCVDWRTPEDDIKGIYMPGWTDWLLDLVFNILTQSNLDVDPEEIRKILVEVIWGEENYYYHSDDHSYDIPGACGCGHDNLVLNNENHVCRLAPKYADYIKKQREKNKGKMEILEWEHNEQGVLSLDIKWVSVVPKWEETSFFVYNQKEVQEILREFISKLNEKTEYYFDINRALEELDREVLSTFDILWSQAPYYSIKFENWKYKIENEWKVHEVVVNYYLWE